MDKQTKIEFINMKKSDDENGDETEFYHFVDKNGKNLYLENDIRYYENEFGIYKIYCHTTDGSMIYVGSSKNVARRIKGYLDILGFVWRPQKIGVKIFENSKAFPVSSLGCPSGNWFDITKNLSVYNEWFIELIYSNYEIDNKRSDEENLHMQEYYEYMKLKKNKNVILINKISPPCPLFFFG